MRLFVYRGSESSRCRLVAISRADATRTLLHRHASVPRAADYAGTSHGYLHPTVYLRFLRANTPYVYYPLAVKPSRLRVRDRTA